MSRPLDLPSSESAYLHDLVGRAHAHLADELVGVWLFGSACRGGYEPGLSDLDVQVMVSHHLDDMVYHRLAADLSHSALPCPATKLELVVYTAEEARAAEARAPRYELNFNTGRTMTTGDHVSLDWTQAAEHWFLLDVASCRDAAIPLCGPPAAEVFGSPSDLQVMRALKQSLDLYHAHGDRGPNSLLNGLRAERWVKERVWCTKLEASEWGPAHCDRPCQIIHFGHDARRGEHKLDAMEVGHYLEITATDIRSAVEQLEKEQSCRVTRSDVGKLSVARPSSAES